MTFRSLRILVVMLAAAAGLLGATPQDYFGRIERARFSVDRVITGGSTIAESPEAFAAQIKQLVPVTERIEWTGGSVETANAWLHEDLDRFAAAGSDADRETIAQGISERLAGISSLGAASIDPLNKDAAKQKLDEILARPEYQKPEAAEESLFQRWWREFLDWLAQMFPKPATSAGPSFSGIGSIQYVLQAVILLLVAALIGFLVYKFLPLVRRGMGSTEDESDGERLILGERIRGDESATSIFSEAEQLAGQGDLRGAIRKGYVAALCELADRKAVRLARHKTNRDYVRDLAERRPLIDTFRTMTGRFERSWYGLQPAGLEDWEQFRAEYHQAIEQVGRSKK